MQTRPEAEVVNLVQQQAMTVADTAGSDLTNWRTTTRACEGRDGETAKGGRWTLNGYAAIPVSPADQLAALSRIRDMWRQQGYEITDDRTFADNTRGALSARDPRSGVTISLATVASLTQIALIMASPCYLPAAGEDPANG